MKNNLENIYQYRRLSNTISTAGQPTQAQLEDIARNGFDVIINLALADADYSLKDEAGLVESLGLRYEHIPVDWENPTKEDLDRFFHIMTKYNGKKIFIHCAANKRVSVFMALLRILQQGWSPYDAIRDMHHVWTPNDRWQYFINSVLSAKVKA